MSVSRETAAWGMRMLLGVEPSDDVVLDLHRTGHDTLESLREALMQSPQARRLFAAATREIRPAFMIPPFLLARPDGAIPWRFEPPGLKAPVSQLCTAEQMAGPIYRRLCERLLVDGVSAHRKSWEFAYLLAVLEAHGMVAPGRRGLGFGVGQEPLPSVLAQAGVFVTATDAPEDLEQSALWERSGQWTNRVDALWHAEIVEEEAFRAHVAFESVDMNRIPDKLTGFDFCWSACCVEHLGSIRHGLDFIHHSLQPLRPGGLSVHTVEFNLSSNGATMETPTLSLFRKRDIELLISELMADGHAVAPLNLWPGTTALDEHVDLPPYGLPHLKLELESFQVTSLGLVVIKDSAGGGTPAIAALPAALPGDHR